MKDLGEVETYIGIEIDYKQHLNEMKLGQTKYIEALSDKYGLSDSKLYDTTMEANLKLDNASEIDECLKYRNLIGELLYISCGTRPDIAYSVNYLSRFQNCYYRMHYNYAMRVLKYLIRTKDVKLVFKMGREMIWIVWLLLIMRETRMIENLRQVILCV